jgi:hypothetical protein
MFHFRSYSNIHFRLAHPAQSSRSFVSSVASRNSRVVRGCYNDLTTRSSSAIHTHCLNSYPTICTFKNHGVHNCSISSVLVDAKSNVMTRFQSSLASTEPDQTLFHPSRSVISKDFQDLDKQLRSDVKTMGSILGTFLFILCITAVVVY